MGTDSLGIKEFKGGIHLLYNENSWTGWPEFYIFEADLIFFDTLNKTIAPLNLIEWES